ncbi:ef hand family protein [Stylonychia lemnae]|uniref:Ef hand family protein n=1 Tax=Stylonychia lemnae TaxID=5949 RepID=A0A078A3S2_STYLE|nr:ef hand family protein [Stylonychia lemnae]|eukprot:CDW76178.1 ef hand family protein [Stylonychia lemnae]
MNTAISAEIDLLSNFRQKKYELRRRLNQLDLEKDKLIDAKTFENEVYKLGIVIQSSQLEAIKQKYQDTKKPHMIKYIDQKSVRNKQHQNEIQQMGFMRHYEYNWQSPTNIKCTRVQNKQTEETQQEQQCYLGKSKSRQQIYGTLRNIKLLNKIMKNSSSNPQSELKLLHQSPIHNQDYGTSKEIQEKLIKKRQITVLDSFVAKDLSCASKSRNIYKNKQNSIFLKASNTTIFDPQQKHGIQLFLKREKVDIKNLMDLKQAFILADNLNLGIIKEQEYLNVLSNQGKRYQDSFFGEFLRLIRTSTVQNNQENEVYLSYAKLMSIIDIFLQYPARSVKESNNSQNVKNTLEFESEMALTSEEDLNRLLKHVHLRIEEKFKSFRDAFRAIDQNFDGSLSFKEFIEGLENFGIQYTLGDFRKVFEYLDHNHMGCIDFKKFCQINIGSVQRVKIKQNQSLSQINLENLNLKRPPLPHNVSQLSIFTEKQKNTSFANGLPPKNQDMSSFSKTIQKTSVSEAKLKVRRSSELPSQTNENYAYGSRNQVDHNMEALISNSYQEIQELGISRNKKYLKTFITPEPEKTPLKNQPHQNTITQILRQQSIKKKYLSFITKQISFKPLRTKQLQLQIQNRIEELKAEKQSQKSEQE